MQIPPAPRSGPQYHASGLNNVSYSAKSSYDLGYTAAYTSYAPYGTSSSPVNNEPGKHRKHLGCPSHGEGPGKHGVGGSPEL